MCVFAHVGVNHHMQASTADTKTLGDDQALCQLRAGSDHSKLIFVGSLGTKRLVSKLTEAARTSTVAYQHIINTTLKVPQCFNVIHNIVTSDVLEMFRLKLIDINIE